MPLFDSHCHLTDKKFDVDREDIINEAEKNGLFMITVGTSYEESVKATALANKYPKNIWATVGIHPEYALEVSENISDELESLVHDKKVVAVGEGGLDYSNLQIFNLQFGKLTASQFTNNLQTPIFNPLANGLQDQTKENQDTKKVITTGDVIQKQKKLFKIQLDLALKYDLPIIMHLRNGNGGENGFDVYKNALEMLDNLPKMPRGVVNFFQGNLEEAKEFLKRGFYLGFDGYITFDSRYDDIIKEIPLDKILVETDSPYVAPVPFRGKRNEPKFVEYVAGKITEVKQINLDEVKDITFKNAKALFEI